MSVVALLPVADADRFLRCDLTIDGLPFVIRGIRGVLDAGCVDRAVVVTAAPHVAPIERLLAAYPSGSDRVTVAASPWGELDYPRLATLARPLWTSRAGEPVDVVLVHDPTRALTPATVIASVVDAVRSGATAVAPVLEVTDTVKRVEADGAVSATVRRETLRIRQTPMGFRPDTLRATGPADAIGGRWRTVPGHGDARRIRGPLDLAMLRVPS